MIMAVTVLSAGVMELIHTCYRIGDIDRSVAFYEALGFEERRRMPIRDEAINVFMGLPGDGDRLELTYNHGVDSYELGTGYNHIALTVDDLDGTLGELGRAGHRAREAAVHGARGRLADLLRARSGRLPDRAHRARLSCSAARLGCATWPSRDSPSSTSGRTRSGSSSSPGRPDALVEAHGRDPRGRAHRRGLDATGELGESRWSARWRRSSSSRTSAAATGIERRRAPVATSAIRDATNRGAFLERARKRSRAARSRVLAREEEARYGYLAAVNSTTLADGVVLDLGGGSMQLVHVVERRLATSSTPGRWARCA